MAKKGSLSITSENIFPVIKKWLYSDHDIFYRELISNGCDAITKLKKLELMGEYEKPEDVDYKIQVSVNQEEKTIKVTDNGLGMPEETVRQLLTEGSRVRKRGSGIGLMNVHQRIRLHFGEAYGLEIESEPEEGTIVRIRLPYSEYSPEILEYLDGKRTNRPEEGTADEKK